MKGKEIHLVNVYMLFTRKTTKNKPPNKEVVDDKVNACNYIIMLVLLLIAVVTATANGKERSKG